MKGLLKTLLCGFFSVSVVPTTYGQNAAIDQVRSQLTAPGGVTVRTSGLWATTIPADHPSEIRITNGKISRGSAVMLHGRINFPIQPGQRLRVDSVESANDPKSDQLRVIIEAAGLQVPIVFVLSKDALVSMTADQLTTLVNPFLQPAMPRSAQPNTPTVIPAAPPPVAAPLPTFVKWSEFLSGPRTKEVKAACEGTDNPSQAYCYAVLLTLYDLHLAEADGEGYKPTYCIPDGTLGTTLRNAFLADTKRRSDQLESPISLFYPTAMETAFPCPKAAPSKRTTTKKSK